jgi:hypothetical protein
MSPAFKCIDDLWARRRIAKRDGYVPEPAIETNSPDCAARSFIQPVLLVPAE